MFNKISVCFFIIFLFNYLACTTLNVATKESVTEEINNGTLRSDIYIITKDNNRYHFGEWGYQIKDDTIIGKGLKINLNGEEPFEGKIPLDDISHFEVKEADTMATVGVVLGAAAFALLALGIITLIVVDDSVESCSQK